MARQASYECVHTSTAHPYRRRRNGPCACMSVRNIRYQGKALLWQVVPVKGIRDAASAAKQCSLQRHGK